MSHSSARALTQPVIVMPVLLFLLCTDSSYILVYFVLYLDVHTHTHTYTYER